METAHFTNIRDVIVRLLDKAEKKVSIAMAWFTSAELFSSLQSCLARGVNVELILLDNATNFMYYAPDFNEFIKSGGILRIAGSGVGFLHHKFCIIDDDIVITGSYNWTYYAETRNVENIIVSDNKASIALFRQEFLRLSSEIEKRDTCPRLTWEEIESQSDIDFKELNYEIERICEVQNVGARKFFETHTEVVKTEIKLNPFAKYDIGIYAMDGNDNVIFKPLIEAGKALPYICDECEMLFNSIENKEFPCGFLYGVASDRSQWKEIREVDLMQIAQDIASENLKIIFSMQLDDNGSLKVNVSCLETGQKLTISALNSNWVIRHE